MKTKQEIIFEAAFTAYSRYELGTPQHCIDVAFEIWDNIAERIKKEQNDKINSLANKVYG